MDKNEYSLKLEEIDKYASQGDYTQAAAIADSIEWKRVRNVRTLCNISEIYEADHRFEESKELLLRAYRRSPVGRSILYRLVEVTIQLKQYDEALEYYTEYTQAAPHDNNRYVLKYKIFKGRGAQPDELIEILKEYLSQEYTEKWAYELARLYQQADHIPECINTCDDLILWFHSGKYVFKALELKKRYAQLTPKQQEIYDRGMEEEEEELPLPEPQEEAQEQEAVSDPDVHEITMEETADAEKEAAEEGVSADIKNAIAMAVERVAARGNEEAAATAEEVLNTDSDAAEEVPDTEKNTADEEAAGNTDTNAADEEAVSDIQTDADTSETAEEEIPEEEPTAKPEMKEVKVFAGLDPRKLQSDLVKSMREIVSGVGRRGEEPEADEIAADEVIELSKEEQAKDRAAREEEVQVQNKVQMPAAKQIVPGQLTIDDILLSMGEKGAAMRDAAEKSAESAAKGVVSAVEEARLQADAMTPEQKIMEEMNLTIEEEPLPEVSAMTEEPNMREMEILPETDNMTKLVLTPETMQVSRMEGDPSEQTDEHTQESIEETKESGNENMENKDIIQAKTRVIPTEEIAQLHAAAAVQQMQTEAPEMAAPAPEAQPVQQEAAPVRENTRGYYGNRPILKEYQKEMFAGFIELGDMEAQIAGAISNAEKKGDDKTSRTGNVLILGGHGCGKTTIATGIAKAIAQDTGNQFIKMAKIYASDFNRKDIASTIAKIAGGILIIEEAGDLDDAVVDQLTTAMEFRTDGLIIILEDEQKYIHELLMRHPRFTMKFTSQIYIPAFRVEDLVRFGQIYAGQQDYVFSEGASAALYNRIGNVASAGEQVSITNVIELVDNAIRRSNKFLRKLGAGRKRYDANNCIILLEKDFAK